jgi:hypothetical protein
MFRATNFVVVKPNGTDCSVGKINKKCKIHCSTLSRYTAELKKLNMGTEDRLRPIKCSYEVRRLFSLSLS